MIPLSILDLSPVCEGSTVAQALADTRRMAQRAEAFGYKRFWLAEHHGMPGIASAATAIVIAHVGQATSTIRIGSGGVMLPNHSPLVIAEQFGTLEALFPGRVDLGLGRAPGTDMRTAQALRRNMEAGAESFPNDIVELQRLLGPLRNDQSILAVPGVNSHVPLWVLGSSLYSAHLAAALGLPYAFASHFAPDYLMEAIAIYRERFTPSSQLSKPYVIAGIMGVAAETDAEAERAFTSAQQQFINLRRNVRGPFPAQVERMDGIWTQQEQINVEHTLRYAVVGSRQTVSDKLSSFIHMTGADEIIVSMPVHDIEARLRSVEIFAEVQGINSAASTHSTFA
jgi:luciferase family oxidoreductase group 1